MNLSKFKINYLNNKMKWSELVDTYHHHKTLRELFDDEKFTKKLLETEYLNTHGVSYALKLMKERPDISAFLKNIPLMTYVLKNSLLGVERLVLFLKETNCYDILLKNKKLFQKLLEIDKDKFFDSENVSMILGKIDKKEEVEALIFNEVLLKVAVQQGKFNKLVNLYKNFDYVDLLIESVEFFDDIQQYLELKNYDHLLKTIDGKNSFEIDSLVKLNPNLLVRCIAEGCTIGVRLLAKIEKVIEDSLQDSRYSDDELKVFEDLKKCLALYKFLNTANLSQTERRVVFANSENRKKCLELLKTDSFDKTLIMGSMTIG